MAIKKELEEKRIKCSKCGSGFIYIRLKDKSLQCRTCGNVDKDMIL
jgi:ribosomal protein S27AE